jgi:cysteinyl-tRNA synthetase
LHNEHLVVEDKKMSKSEGTSYVVDDVINKGYDPVVLRYFFLQAHYRSKQNFTWDALEGAKRGLQNIKEQVKSLGGETGNVNQDFKNKFLESLDDDFNTPKALAVLQEVLKSDIPNPDKLATVLDFDKVLGLGLDKIEEEKIPQEIVDLAEARKKAKQEKDFTKADEIRGTIETAGYMVEDLPDGEYKIIKK